MRPFIVIRQFQSDDTVRRKELIKQYVMSFALDAFVSCLFREVYFLLLINIWSNKMQNQLFCCCST